MVTQAREILSLSPWPPVSSKFLGRRGFCCNAIVLAEARTYILENSMAKYCFNPGALFLGEVLGHGCREG